MPTKTLSTLLCVLATCASAVACATPSAPGTRTPVNDAPTIASFDELASDAAGLPPGAELHVALAGDGALGVLVSTRDRRIWAHLYLRPPDPHTSELEVVVDFERDSEDRISVEAEAISGGLMGSVQVEAGTASWRVAHDGDGSLHAERWSPGLARRCPTLRLARDISVELEHLRPQLGAHAPLAEPDLRALLERVSLAQVALELGLRACESRARAELPRLTAPFAWR